MRRIHPTISTEKAEIRAFEEKLSPCASRIFEFSRVVPIIGGVFTSGRNHALEPKMARNNLPRRKKPMADWKNDLQIYEAGQT
jgi:hypothetical protein